MKSDVEEEAPFRRSDDGEGENVGTKAVVETDLTTEAPDGGANADTEDAAHTTDRTWKDLIVAC